MGRIGVVVKRSVIGLSLFSVALIAVAAIGISVAFKRAEPVVSGEIKVAGLSAPVRIYRDTFGIPSIFASTPNDSARALGYVHAGERLFQMEMQRRAGQGRLSEILGQDTLDIDKFIRTLGLYPLAQTSFDAMSPESKAYFESYADGVNAWLKENRHHLPVEFLLLNHIPEKWEPADSVVWGKLMALELSHNYRLEILRSQIQSKLSSREMGWIFPMPPVGTPITTEPQTTAAPSSEKGLRDAHDQLASLLGLDHAASNEWVIGGDRTVSGKPILANDPHLGLEAPILWYLARLVTPGGMVKGATVPGLPVVVLGQNDNVAWGFTTTGSDTEDLFIETVDPSDPTRYLTPDGSAPFETHDEVIHIKNAPDIVLPVRKTRHGPVLSDVSKDIASITAPGKVMALAFTGLGAPDLTSQALLQIDHAHSAKELLEALKLYQTPTQNIVYADNEGTFGYISPGLVPIRHDGDGLMPVDGASGEFDWTGIIPLERDPQIANPKSGYVFNANNAVVDQNSADYFGQDWEEPYRARRLQQFFDTTDRFSLANSALMQADHLSLVATDFLPLLLAFAPQNRTEQAVLDMMRGWDGVMDRAKPQPAFFEAWLLALHHRLLQQKTGSDLKDKGPFSAMTMQALLDAHAKDWCGEAHCEKIVAGAFEEATAMMMERQGAVPSKWRWGRENRATLIHKFYSHIPLLKNLSDLSVASSGDFYTLDRGGGFDNDAAHPFARTHGGGYRGIYDLSNPDASLFMIATGESDHIFSKHYGDLVGPWNDGKSITISGSAEEMKQKGASLVVLRP